MMKRIYFDYNASTPLDSRVLQVFVRELQEIGNPSSIHFYGQQCRRQLDRSRQIIARFFGVKPQEIIFTSGGTEGAALLISGALNGQTSGHIISSAAEHACVYQTLKNLEKQGTEVTFLPVGEWGAVRPEAIEEAIRPNTRLMTLIASNNETGVLTDIEAIAAIAQRVNIPFIVDGVAWLGKELIHLPKGVSAAFFSGHKIYGPKGIGFCVCRSSLKLTPLFAGGGQELNRRGGTENLPGIVALAEAIRLLEQEQETDISRIRRLRDRFEQSLLAQLSSQVVINGLGPRVSNTSNLAFLGVDGESLLMNLDLQGIGVSLGSACASGALEPSRVLLGMGIPVSRAMSSIRFSIGRMTTEEEVDRVVEAVCQLISRLK